MGPQETDLFASMRLASASAPVEGVRSQSDLFRHSRQMTMSSADVRHSKLDFRHTQAIGMLLGRTNTNGLAILDEWTQLLCQPPALQRGPDQSGDDMGCNDAEHLPRFHGSVPLAGGG